MSTQTESNQSYSIMEAARLSGLPESTLRYYETIGVIEPIRRDTSSKHRIYSEDDINLVISVACLSATGMSIGDMRTYLDNRSRGAQAAGEQVTLLETQQERLATEAHYLKLREQYVNTKIDYWKAVEAGDAKLVEAMKLHADAIAKELKLPKKFKEEG
jgi:DNA-binding transcriptional MerR regulator